MKSARIGGTEVLNNFIGYIISHDPGPTMYVLPVDKLAEDWSKEILDTLLRDTPILQGKVSEQKLRTKENTILRKNFQGGSIRIGGANSPAFFRMKTIRYLIMDDVDGFPAEAGTEGNPVRLAEKRTLTFANHKIVMVSTPTEENTSRIWQAYEASNQQHYFVPCPMCKHHQVLVFGKSSMFQDISRGYIRYHYDGREVTTVSYVCENCGKDIPESAKHEMVKSGRWQPLFPNRRSHQGFHIWEGYSPWSSWRRIVEDFIATKDRREDFKTTVNVTFGEVWKESGSLRISEQMLLNRVEEYETIPEGVALLTASADVQAERVEVAVMGWGSGEESWIIEKAVIYKSPDRAETWNDVHEFIMRERKHALGVTLIPEIACIDSGFSADQVYKFVKARHKLRFFAIKGKAGFDQPLIIKVHNKNKLGANLAILGVDNLKQRIHDRLYIEQAGPGYIHFNGQCNLDFFQQLTAERRVMKEIKGSGKKYIWELPKGKRNEAFDLMVYNLAAYHLIRPNMEILRAKLLLKAEAAKSLKTDEEEVSPVQKKRLVRPRGNFAKNW